MKIIASNLEKEEILKTVGKWANLSPKELKKIKYFDDLLKVANENEITITIEKQ